MPCTRTGISLLCIPASDGHVMCASMKSDITIKHEGFMALKEKLGSVDMERFIVLINREKTNYTKWRKDLFEEMTMEELAKKADEFSTKLQQNT